MYTESELDKKVDDILSLRLEVFKKEIKDEISGMMDSIFGKDSSIGDALGAGLDNAVSSLINGRQLNARSIANAAARTLVPEVKDYFNKSGKQLGEDLMGLITSAQRNL